MLTTVGKGRKKVNSFSSGHEFEASSKEDEGEDVWLTSQYGCAVRPGVRDHMFEYAIDLF